ncbi:hypothetical protein niasHT_037272 [Heterodera trifolii]|uniref:Uncharacterized protein n=1 Tax=Heterodera trifolii TaxID=157864 RepID=A0ABD2IV99_9BILA
MTLKASKSSTGQPPPPLPDTNVNSSTTTTSTNDAACPSTGAAAKTALSFAPVPLPKLADRDGGGRTVLTKQHHQQLNMRTSQADLFGSLKNGATVGEIGPSSMASDCKISEDEIRKSLLVEAKRRKFWNAKTIEKMDFQEIVPFFCHHYVLESFTETRSVAEAIDASSSSSATASIGRTRSEDHDDAASGSRTFASSTSAFGASDQQQQQIHRRTSGTTTFVTGTAAISRGSIGLVELKTFGMASSNGTELGLNPWDFDVQPDDDFVSQTKILEMPNSHRLGACHSCKGEMLVHCFHCRGSGNDKCSYCRGTGMKAGVAHPAVYTHPMIGGGTFPGAPASVGGCGVAGTAPNRGAAGFHHQHQLHHPFANPSMVRPALLGAQRDKPYAAGTPVHFMAKAGLPPPGIGQHDLCIFCHGRGIRDCQHCKGQGKKHCLTCGGNGQVHVYTKLKVVFSVECTDYYSACGVPEVLLRQASGELIFSETRPYVQPIKRDGLTEINDVSRRFCAAHLKKLLDSCRVLKQRHCVESIEVAKVRFRLGSKMGHFFVYGRQRLCYIPEGPTRCSVM